MITHLEISSFVGYSIGAEHYYGKLRHSSGEHEELLRVLDQDAADKLNSLDNHQSYRAGDMSYRFDSEECVVREGIRQFKDNIGVGILLQGSTGYCDPKKVLFAFEPYDKVANRLTEIYEAYEAEHERIGHHNWSDVLDQLCDEWDDVLASVEEE